MATYVTDTLGFNPAPPTVMYLDVNSCFATVEQQANPMLRGKPVVVAAYAENHGCILAASREAKRLGIKTGMRVREARLIYPRLTVLPPDPAKYRAVNRSLTDLVGSYTPAYNVASIDELSFSLAGTPSYLSRVARGMTPIDAMRDIAAEMKRRIHDHIGDWITVSIGISTNWYLAKIASNLKKPDGLEWITKENIEDVFSALPLTELTSIKEGNAARLWRYGIASPLAFYRAPMSTLRAAFRSIEGYWWWVRLHGWDDDRGGGERKTVGHSVALAQVLDVSEPKLLAVMRSITDKTGRRLRRYGMEAHGAGVSCLYDGGLGYWGKTRRTPASLWADADLFAAAAGLLAEAPAGNVRIIAVQVFGLTPTLYAQARLFDEDLKTERMTRAMDAVRDRWGETSIMPAIAMTSPQRLLDRIAFGKSGLGQ